jgi:hypothetical protein
LVFLEILGLANMSVQEKSKSSAYGWLTWFGDPAVRMGIYTGTCLGLTFCAWVYVANRVPVFERFASQRNLAAAVLLGLLAAIPTMRYFRDPGKMLTASLIGWAILTFFYRLMCSFFGLLSDKYSPLHIFMLGAVVYLMAGTMSWIGTLLWRAKHTQSGSRFNHHIN